MSARTAVVVVTRDHLEDLKSLLPSLARQTRPCDTIIVSDNGSSDGTLDWLADAHAGVRVIRNAENLGFAEGCNVAIRAVLGEGAEYVILLNPDCEVEETWAEELVRTAESDPRVGICQSKIYLDPPVVPPLINSAGNRLHYTGVGTCGHLGEEDRGQFAEDAEIAVASGAAMLVKAAVLRDVGLLDGAMFMYHEDTDLCVRARIAGHRIVLSARSRLFHKYRFGKNPLKFYYADRNRILSLLKTYELRTLIVLAPALLALEAAVWYHAARNGWLRLKLRAYLEIVRLRAHWLAERRRIQASRTLGDAELAAFLSHEIVVPGEARSRLLRALNGWVFGPYYRGFRFLVRPSSKAAAGGVSPR